VSFLVDMLKRSLLVLDATHQQSLLYQLHSATAENQKINKIKIVVTYRCCDHILPYYHYYQIILLLLLVLQILLLLLTHPFNGPFSGTAQVSRYQKGKTNLDFTEARDSEWQWHQLGHMQVCISLQTDKHASTLPLRFLQAG